MGDDPLKLDWGEIFVESYNTQTKIATLIYNFNFDETGIMDCFWNYTVAHLFWVYKNLPPDSSIKVAFDLRGIDHRVKEAVEFGGKIKDHLFSIDSSLRLEFEFNH